MLQSVRHVEVHPKDPNLVLEVDNVRGVTVRIYDLLGCPKADAAAASIGGGVVDACWVCGCGEGVVIVLMDTGALKAYSVLLCLLAPPPVPGPEALEIRTVPAGALGRSITSLVGTSCEVTAFCCEDGTLKLGRARPRDANGHDGTLWFDILKTLECRPGSPISVCGPKSYVFCPPDRPVAVLKGFGAQNSKKRGVIDFPEGAVGVMSLAASTDVVAALFDIGNGSCQLCAYSTYEVPPIMVHSETLPTSVVEGPLQIHSVRDTNAVVIVVSSGKVVVRSRTYADGERWVSRSVVQCPSECCALVAERDGMGWDKCFVSGRGIESFPADITKWLSRSSLPFEDSNPVVTLHRALNGAFTQAEDLPDWCHDYAADGEAERLLTDGPSRRFFIKLAFVLSPKHMSECDEIGVAINTEDCFLATIGKCQAFLLQLVTRAAPSTDDNADLWSTYFRRLGVGFWADSPTLIRSTVLDLLLKRSLAKYRRTKELSVIEKEAALWLALLGRQKVLASLYKQHGQMTSDPKAMRISSFLAMDFSTSENKNIGSKNAFELVRQKRHSMAAAVFLLVGDVHSAVNVATRYLEDVQLAILFVRCANADGIIDRETMDDIWAEKFPVFDAWVDFWRLWSSRRYPDLANKLAAGSLDVSVTGSGDDREGILGVLPTPPHLSTCSRRDIFDFLSSAVPAFGAAAEGLAVVDTPKRVVATRLLGRGLAALLPPVGEDTALTTAVHWARRASILFDENLTPRKSSKMPSCIPGQALPAAIGSELQSYWLRRVRGPLLDPRLNPMPPAPELWTILSRLVDTSKGGLLPRWAAELTSMVFAGIGDWSTSIPEVQEAAAAVVLSELERLLIEYEAEGDAEAAKDDDDGRLTLAEHYTGVLFELLQPGSSPQVAVDAEAPPLTCLNDSTGSASRLRCLVVCALVLERVLSPPKGSSKLTVYERQYQLLVRWHLKSHVYEAMGEPEAVEGGKADEPTSEHPLETILGAPRRLKLLQSTCPMYRRSPEQEKEHLPKSVPLPGIMSQLGWHSVTGLCLDRSAGASLRLALSAGHETGVVRVIDLPQHIRGSLGGCCDGVTPEEYYREPSRWRMDIERSVINSNTNLPADTKIVPSERTRVDLGDEPSLANHLGSGLPLRQGCRIYASDVMLLSLGINWATGVSAHVFQTAHSSDTPTQLPLSNSLTAHPTASVFASTAINTIHLWSFGCSALGEPAQELCSFKSQRLPSPHDPLRTATWSENGETLAGFSKNGYMLLWSARRPEKPIISFQTPFIRGNDIKALTASGSLMLICGRETPDGSGGAAMIDCRAPELVVRKWNAGPGKEYTCASGLSHPLELQLGTCDGQVVDVDTRSTGGGGSGGGGACKTVMRYMDGHERSPALYSLMRYGSTDSDVVAVTHGSALGVLRAGEAAGSFDSSYAKHKGGMGSAMQAAFSKIGPKLVAAADACGTVAITAGTSDQQVLLHRLP